ncbi:heme o synthase [Georgenia sp. Z1344]|uniref:heme o synthase n=1 Tax=Georgenia sp. Z1344 TaxID=3416706 RepID=UPI003CF7D2AF
MHPGRRRSRLAAYVALTKPRIIELLLVTTLPTMVLAADGWPGWWKVIVALVGGAIAAGSANAFNMVLDRDIDAVMNRTRERPLVTGEIRPRDALVFASVLGVVSVAWFALLANLVASALTLAAILLYVVFYTMILKRRTSQNIVWGGVAGCMPVVIGWSVVTGSLDWPALVLFLIVFFWTPPHYWPLSMKFTKDYQRAGVPMLGAVKGAPTVATHGLVYAVLTVATSLALIPVASTGWFYAVAAVLSGGWFLLQCAQLVRLAGDPRRGRKQAMTVFHGSITYLSVLFLAVAIDPFVP